MVKCLLPLLPERPVVVDVGANRGEWAELIPNAQLILFEPHEMFSNYLRIKFKKAKVIERLVWSKADREIPFYYCTDEHDGVSSAYENKAWNLPYKISQKKTVIMENECDFLKIDAEGSEYEILSGMTSRPKLIQFEYGEMTKVANRRLKDLEMILEEKGYRVYQFDGVGFKRLTKIIENYRLTNFMASTEDLEEFKTYLQRDADYPYESFLDEMAEQMPGGCKALFVGRSAAAAHFLDKLGDNAHRVISIGKEPPTHRVEYLKNDLTSCRHFADGDIDFLFVDINTNYNDTSSVLQVWKNKVKQDGIIAGFDFSNRETAQAVRSSIDSVIILSEGDTIWWTLKKE